MVSDIDRAESASAARRAAVLYWVLAALAIAFGLMLFGGASAWPELSKDPRMQPLVEEFRKHPEIDPATLFTVLGVGIASYGALIAMVAIFVWRVSLVGLIVGLSVAALVAVTLLLLLLTSIIAGAAGNVLLPLIILIAHAWLIRWQIAALRGSSAVTATFTPPPAYVPMGAYYQPPVPPTRTM